MDQSRQYRIRAVSLMGGPTWITNVEPTEIEGEQTYIVSKSSLVIQARLFSKEEAESVLPAVHTTNPEAVIEKAGIKLCEVCHERPATMFNKNVADPDATIEVRVDICDECYDPNVRDREQ